MQPKTVEKVNNAYKKWRTSVLGQKPLKMHFYQTKLTKLINFYGAFGGGERIMGEKDFNNLRIMIILVL